MIVLHGAWGFFVFWAICLPDSCALSLKLVSRFEHLNRNLFSIKDGENTIVKTVEQSITIEF